MRLRLAVRTAGLASVTGKWLRGRIAPLSWVVPATFGTAIFAVVGLLCPSDAAASTIQCCTISSDATPASQLQSTFDFQVSGATLTLRVDNDTVVPSEFNINEIFFDASPSVASLVLTSATHSDTSAGNNLGDVFGSWQPVFTDEMANGFGPFDFALFDGVGEENPAQIGPGEEIEFVLSINGGVGTFSMADFGPLVAAKFVNGPDDPESPGNEDSAFGTVPEPSTSLLLGIGLTGLAAMRRRGAKA